ncbi:dienelactone hydrolase [Rhodopirellula rubra]|uniref:Dienelactone hydrolase n=1 Tax=Aporhodopirellula rubra TaxID=980271 RepID=A0A7W5H9K0_9BACT|nr:hypothetical protein [Aporhodopirellula rubra]MBB3210190.1 dienelactone hydrolase [Aporhodopirellula rubra]
MPTLRPFGLLPVLCFSFAGATLASGQTFSSGPSIVQFDVVESGDVQSGEGADDSLQAVDQPSVDDEVSPEPSGIEPAVSTDLPEEVIEQRLQATPTAEFDARANDEIWLVSSRHLRSRGGSVEHLDVRRRVDGSRWQSESPHSLLGSDPTGWNRPVVIFVHGNRWDLNTAIRRGLQGYDQTIVPWDEAPSIRYVIWTWPADEIPGPIRDVRVKASKADQHSFHLARFLNGISPQTPISLMGFSYGGRVALGALHLMGGGRVDGCGLETTTGMTPAGYPSHRVNLTLVVPAIRNSCLIGTRSKAYSQINHLFLVYNSRDKYLGLFKFTRFSGKTPALGYTGICGLNRLADHPYRVDQFNASRAVGAEHSFLEYISDHRVEARLRNHLLTPTR